MKKLLPIALAIVAGSTLLPRLAAAQNARPFGQEQLIVSADRLMGLFAYASIKETSTANNVSTESTASYSGMSLLMGGNRSADVVHTIPRVSVDYALAMRLTVGGSIPVSLGLGGKSESKTPAGSVSNDSPTTTIIGFAPRVGYVLTLSDSVHLWPRGGFAYYRATQQRTAAAQGNAPASKVTDTSTFLSIDIDPQLVITPFSHVGITLGPTLNIPIGGTVESESQLGTNAKTVTEFDRSVFHFGVMAGMLVYF